MGYFFRLDRTHEVDLVPCDTCFVFERDKEYVWLFFLVLDVLSRGSLGKVSHRY